MEEPIKLGVAYEGELDFIAIEVILKKILSPKSINFAIVEKITPHTGLVKLVGSYVKIFFEIKNIDVAVFFTDQNTDREDRKQRILEEIVKVNPGYQSFCAVGVSNPHFERWLLADQEAVKRVFKLKADHEVPFKEEHPKERLERLRGSISGERLSKFETFYVLASELSIEKVKTVCSDFRLFVDDLLSACKCKLMK